jgi:cholesterol transport system auxiliary component
MTACSVIALSAGCAVPGGGEPPRRIRLAASEQVDSSLPVVDWALLVNEPTTTLSLNTAKIAIGTRDDIKYLANGEWASRAPVMVMELLVQSFKNSGKITNVGDRRARLRPDFILDLQMTGFHIAQTVPESGTIRVGLDVTLVEHARRKSIGSKSFKSSAEVSPLSLDKIVAAFEISLRQVQTEVVEWTLRSAGSKG